MWFLVVIAFAADRDLLFVGNSYTASNGLVGLVEGASEARQPWADTRAVELSQGGWTWADHAARVEEGGAWQQAFADTWDVVVLQEQSQIPGFPMEEAVWQESLASLQELAQAAEPADVALLLTWGRLDGDRQNPDLYPDFPTMQDRLTAGYLAYADSLGGATVIPAGEAFRALWAQGPDEAFFQLYVADESHPTPYGTHMVATTAHAALTGRDPSEVTVPWPEVDTAILEAHHEVVRELVLREPFGPYGYPWAQEWTDGRSQVGGAGMRPVVRVTGEGTTDALVVGGTEDGLAADGELWIGVDASLSATTLSAGVDGTGVVVLDGTLDVDDLVLGDGAAFVWSGTLAATTVTGDLVQDGGVLRIDAPVDVSGRWTVHDGDVALAMDVEPGEQVLVTAAAVDPGPVDEVAGYPVAVVARDGRDALVATVPGAATGRTDGGSSSIAEEAGGCGCAASTAVPWGSWARRP